MTYTLKFRQHVFALKEKHNLTFEATSKRFDLSIRTLFRWQAKLEPCTTRNKPATKIDMLALSKDVQDHPDDYQWERAKRFGVSPNCIWAALRRLGVTYKKNAASSKSRRRKPSQLRKEDETL
jgi:transposase